MTNRPTTFIDYERVFDQHVDEGDHTCSCGSEYGEWEDHFTEVRAEAYRVATGYRDALIERLLLAKAGNTQ